MTSKELQERRNKLIADAKAFNDKIEEEDRAMTADETAQFDKMISDAQDLKERIDKQERAHKLELKIETTADPIAARKEQPGDSTANPADTERRAAFAKFLRDGRSALTEPETRALQADSDVAGGYTIASEQFVNDLLAAVDNEVFIRPLANKVTVPTAQSLGYPALNTDISDADWTSELATGTEDTSLDFGKRELHPYPLAKLVKVSGKLLRLSTGGAEALVRQRMAYKFGVTEEKAFLTGSGAMQPLGVFTASAQGIDTGRDYATDMTTTSMSVDGLIGVKYTLKSQYHAKARWAFHRDGVAQISKLKAGDGHYLWRESIRVGEPDTLLGFPIMMSEYVPNTFTAALYVGILGDFSHYMIADALNFQVQRLVELYAATNQIGFIGRAELDGLPVLEEAFVRVKLAAS